VPLFFIACFASYLLCTKQQSFLHCPRSLLEQIASSSSLFSPTSLHLLLVTSLVCECS
jgi:hypothetical protein